MIGAPASIAVNRQNGNQIGYADVSTMLSKLAPMSLQSAVWAFTPTAQPQLLQLADGSNRAVMLTTNCPGQRPQFSVAGLPAFPTDTLPALGTKGDLVLMDPRFYGILTHGTQPTGTLEIATSDQVNFLANQIILRVTRRIDGQPLLDQKITLGDGASTASPFVVLN